MQNFLRNLAICVVVVTLAVSLVNTVYAEESTQLVGVVDASVLNVRESSTTDSEVISKLYDGQEVTIEYDNGNGWYCIDIPSGGTGFVSANYIDLSNGDSTETGDKVEQLLTIAKKYVGVPYVYGASGPRAFDCSGFTSYVFKQMGVSLPRSASAQSQTGVHISKSNLQAGDLVFFATGSSGRVSHVGIYMGDGKLIHAATGQGHVVINDFNSSYYQTRFKWGIRVF